MKKKKYLSTIQAADILGISRVAVFNKIKKGEIKAEKIGRNYIIEVRQIPQMTKNTLTVRDKKTIQKAVDKTVKEYGETLRLLGRE